MTTFVYSRHNGHIHERRTAQAQFRRCVGKKSMEQPKIGGNSAAGHGVQYNNETGIERSGNVLAGQRQFRRR